MNTLSQLFKISAIKSGMCDKFIREWKEDETEESLIDKYKRGLDFCIAADFPVKEMILANFSREIMRQNNIFVADDVNLSHLEGHVIVRDGSTGSLHFGAFDAATIWVLHDSEITITASGEAFVFIHAYHNSHVTIEQSGASKVVVKVHGDEATAITRGNVSYIKSDK